MNIKYNYLNDRKFFIILYIIRCRLYTGTVIYYGAETNTIISDRLAEQTRIHHISETDFDLHID